MSYVYVHECGMSCHGTAWMWVFIDGCALDMDMIDARLNLVITGKNDTRTRNMMVRDITPIGPPIGQAGKVAR